MFLFVSALFVFVSVQRSSADTTFSWDHSVVHKFPSNSTFLFQWSLIKGNQILLNVQVATTGWIGLGLSENGAMKGADLIVGWVDDSQVPHLLDMHGVGNRNPVLDEIQDVELVHAEQNETTTSLTFSRDLDTCDVDDFRITDQTIRILFAYNDQDPGEDNSPEYHGPSYRGVRSVILLQGQRHNLKAEDPRDMDLTWNLRGVELTLPSDSTTYWCSLIKIPGMNKPHHLIRYSPLITPGNENIVHHMVVHECITSEDDKSFESFNTAQGHVCRVSTTPMLWKKCRGIAVAWGIGGSDYEFPPDIGYLFDTTSVSSPKYLLLEIHYNNELNEEGIKDNSGFQLMLTPRLRRDNAAILSVGADVSSYLIIPPRQPHFTIASHCSVECLQEKLPKDGIKFISGILHTHLLGVRIKLRQFRQGKELPPVLKDDNYDFNYQESRFISPFRAVLPGDHLSLECTYDTRHLNWSTVGGFETNDEMCVAFMMFYPANDLRVCMSRPRPVDISETFSVPFGGYYRRPVVMNTNSSLQDFLRNYSWSVPRVTKLEQILRSGIQEVKCYGTGKRHVTLKRNLTGYPDIQEEVTDMDTCSPVMDSVVNKAPGLFTSSVSTLCLAILMTRNLLFGYFCV